MFQVVFVCTTSNRELRWSISLLEPTPGWQDFLVKIQQQTDAGVAQLAEHNVANVVVVGSNPITRSYYGV